MQNSTLRNNFIFTCGKLPVLQGTVTSVSLPTISMSETQFPTRVHDIVVPSTKVIYDPINIEFVIDEQFDNYKEAFDWIQELRVYRGSDIRDLTSDATLQILSNNKQPLKRIRFEGMFPTILSEVLFTTQDSGGEAQTCNLTLAYTQFLFA